MSIGSNLLNASHIRREQNPRRSPSRVIGNCHLSCKVHQAEDTRAGAAIQYERCYRTHTIVLTLRGQSLIIANDHLRYKLQDTVLQIRRKESLAPQTKMKISQPPHRHYCCTRTHNAGVDCDDELDEDVLKEVVSLKRFLYGQDNKATLVEDGRNKVSVKANIGVGIFINIFWLLLIVSITAVPSL